MPRLLSNENIQLIFSAKDRTRAALKSMNSGLKGVAIRAKEALTGLASLGGRKILSGLKKVTSAITTIAGIGGAASFGGLVASGLAAGDTLAKTADRIGTTTEELTKLRFAISQTSELAIPAQNKALQQLVRSISEAAAGYGTAKKSIDELGLDAQRLNNIGAAAAFGEIAESINGVQNAADRVRLTETLFGARGASILTTLDEGKEGIRLLGLEAERLGLTFNRIELGRIEAANDALARMKDVVQAAGIALAIDLSPKIEALVENTLEWVKAQGGIGVVVDRAIESAQRAIEKIADFTSGLGGLFSTTEKSLIGVALSLDTVYLTALRTAEALNDRALAFTDAQKERKLQNDLTVNTKIAEVLERRIQLSERLNQLDGVGASSIGTLGDAPVSSPDQVIASLGGRSISTPSSAIETVEKTKQGNKQLLDLQAQRLAEERKRELESAQSTILQLQTSLDERLRIRNEYNQKLSELQKAASTANLVGSELTRLEEAIASQRDQQLQELAARAAEERNNALNQYQQRLSEIAQQESAALDISSIVNFDVSQNLESGLKNLQEIFNREENEIQAAVALSEPAKTRALSELQQFKQQAEQGLQLNAKINSVTQGLDNVSAIGGSLAQLVSGGDNGETEAFRQRAQEITSIRQQLQQAFADGNVAEVQSLQNKIQNLTRLQQAEDTINKRRFKRERNYRLGLAVIDTASAALKGLNSPPAPNFAAMTAALLAGAVQIKSIASQKYESPSVGGISSGGASGGASGSTTAPTAAQLQQTGTAAAPQNGTLTVQFPDRGARGWTDDEVQDMFDAIDDGLNTGRYSNARWQRTGT